MYEFLLSCLEFLFGWLPDTVSFSIPPEVSLYGSKIFDFVGWLMPFELYSPLIGFIVSFIGFRIVYSIILRVRDFSRR